MTATTDQSHGCVFHECEETRTDEFTCDMHSRVMPMVQNGLPIDIATALSEGQAVDGHFVFDQPQADRNGNPLGVSTYGIPAAVSLKFGIQYRHQVYDVIDNDSDIHPITGERV